MKLSLTVFAAALSAPAQSSDFQICHHNSELSFRGPITPESADALIRNLRGNSVLVIESPGGDAASGQRLAEAVLKYGVNIKVTSHCLSACANYVFLAGKKKVLAKDAILGFHGGFTGDGPTGQSEVAAALRRLHAKDKAIYRRLAVSQKLFEHSYQLTEPKSKPIHVVLEVDGIVVIDQEKANLDEALLARVLAEAVENKRMYSLKVITKNASSDTVYFPSEATLKKFGVSGIVAYAYPRDAAELKLLGSSYSGQLKIISDLEGVRAE